MLLASLYVLEVSWSRNSPFYGTRRFITVSTTARHWSLSWVR